MERRLIIHVGPHKTASTYIQRTVQKNSKRLEGLNIGIPRQPVSGTMHSAFAKNMSSQNQSFWDKELEPLRSKTQIVISSESFCRKFSTKKNLDFLLKISKRHDLRLTFVYFVRDQTDLITSHYCHGIRRFYHSENFKDYLKARLKKDRSKHRRSYNLHKRFKHYLDRQDFDLIFIPLSRKVDPFLEMANKLDWPHDAEWGKLNEGESRNEQPGCKGIWLSRDAYEICEKANYQIESLKGKGQAIRNIAIEKGWHHDRFCGYTDFLYKKVRRYYRKSNQKFSQKVWGDDWDNVVETKQKPLQIYRGPGSYKEYKEALSVLKNSFKKMGWANLELQNLTNLAKAVRPKLSRFSF